MFREKKKEQKQKLNIPFVVNELCLPCVCYVQKGYEVVAEGREKTKRFGEWGIIVKWVVKVAPIEFYD